MCLTRHDTHRDEADHMSLFRAVCKIDLSLGIQTLEFFRRIPTNLDSLFLNESYIKLFDVNK